MQLSVYQLDGHAINDGSSFRAYFPRGSVMLGIGLEPQYVDLAYEPPTYTTSHREVDTVELHIQCLGTIHSQMDTLRGYYLPPDLGEIKLLCKDTANSDKQWYFMVSVKEFSELDGQQAVLTLKVADLNLYAETATSTAWTVSATGSTKAASNTGNYKAFPIFTITPTANKTIGAGSAAGANLYKAFFAVPGVPVPLTGYPFDLAEDAWDTASLIADNSNKAQLNGAVNNSVTTFDYDTVTGALPSAGMAYIDTEQFSWTAKSGTQLTGVTRGIGGTTAASHLDNAVFKVSYIQANGADIRVSIDGVNVDRWLDGMNTSTTKVWIVTNLATTTFVRGGSYDAMLLGTAIAGAGAITTITLSNPKLNIPPFWLSWNALPLTGILKIGTELFTYTTRTGDQVLPPKFGGVTRTVKGSSIAAHSAGDTVTWIEHSIDMTFGDPTLTAPTIPTSRQPMIDLATSTNSSHYWTDFFDNTGTRALAWSYYVNAPSAPLNTSHAYTGNRNTIINPATEAGEAIENYISGGKYYSPASTITWRLQHSGVITAVTATGEKYRVGTIWPSAQMYSAATTSAYLIWTEATPASASTWTSWSSHSAVTVPNSGSYTLILQLAGAVSLTAGALAYTELETLTATLSSTYIPDATMYITAPSPTAPTNYDLNATLTNNTSGDSIAIRFAMDLNQALEIDCLNHTVTYLKDNSPAIGAITPVNSDSLDWITIEAGSNTLQWDETGAAGYTVAISHQDRMI